MRVHTTKQPTALGHLLLAAMDAKGRDLGIKYSWREFTRDYFVQYPEEQHQGRTAENYRSMLRNTAFRSRPREALLRRMVGMLHPYINEDLAFLACGYTPPSLRTIAEGIGRQGVGETIAQIDRALAALRTSLQQAAATLEAGTRRR